MSSPEFRILRQSVRLDDHEDAIGNALNIILSNKINWDELYARADLHSIKPFVAKIINKLPPLSVPENFRDRINEAYRENLYHQLRNTAEFFRIKDTLENEGIISVPYKGFWLAHEFYGNLADRESVDIDLYIHFRDLDRIIRILPLLGYKAEKSSSPEFIRKIKRESAEFNFDRFEGPERLYHVEFHWKTGSSMHGLDISLDELSSHIIPGKLQNKDLQAFSQSANLLLAIMHHGGKDSFLQLKQVADIGVIIKNSHDIDWEWILGKARQYKMENLVYLALRLASEITGIKTPEALKIRTDSKNIRRLADERIRLMEEEAVKLSETIYRSLDLQFHLRTRNSFKIRTGLITSNWRSAILSFIMPHKLLNYYLKKRYNIDKPD
ncbi:MAG: nucleotidyltransferase family protein [Bacteroidales bacterium]|nr:nucleotidyltransferase family protein [Bacteroidales bacterium]